ncbi:hypothetical protein AVEN_80797-1 [Araneus ventricosus]|uniref:Uncharacterized protein n=1 Tax=Araneus ventricosus TaxID=182803 RepID=A0A4Y2FJU0_ARAVE|nr:hypothetical protein AVEN_80797-1 [Araneus ventricosus]
MMGEDSCCWDSSLGKEVSHFFSLVPDMGSNQNQPDIFNVKQKSLNFSGYFVCCVSIGYCLNAGLAMTPDFDVTLYSHRISDCFVGGCNLCLVH